MERNNDQIRQLFLDSVQEFQSCCFDYGNFEFDSNAYDSDVTYHVHYDNAFINWNMSAVTLAFVIRSYKDFMIFPDRILTISAIDGNFNVFYDLFSGSLVRLRTIDQQIRTGRSNHTEPEDNLYSQFGHAVRNFAICCYFLSCYAVSVVEDVHFKIDT